MELIAKELANPERDCKKFDPGMKIGPIQGEIARSLRAGQSRERLQEF
jgi:hypothetical protein